MTKRIEQIEKARRPCHAVLNKIAEIITYLSDSKMIAGPGIQLRETAGGIVISSEQTECILKQAVPGSSAYDGPFALSFSKDEDENSTIVINLRGAYLHTPCNYSNFTYDPNNPPSIEAPSDSSNHILYLDFEDTTEPFLTYESGAGGNAVSWHRVPVGRATKSSIEQWLYGSVVYSAQFAEIY